MPLDASLSRSSDSSIDVNCRFAPIQQRSLQVTRQPEGVENACLSPSTSHTWALQGSRSPSSPFSCMLQQEQAGGVKTSGSTWTAREFLAHTADRPDTAHGRSVYVANMVPGTSKEALKSAIDLLLEHGCVLAVEMRERNNLQPYAFVELSTLQAAYELVQHKRTALVLHDQQLKVQFKKIGLTCSFSSSSICTSSSTAFSPPQANSSTLSCCACCCPRKNATRTSSVPTAADNKVSAAGAEAKACVSSAGESVQQEHPCEFTVCSKDACMSKSFPVRTGETPTEQNGTQVRCCHLTRNDIPGGGATSQTFAIRGSSICQADCLSCTACGRSHVCYVVPSHSATAVKKENSCCGCTCSSAPASSAADSILLQLQPFLATGETVLEVCRAVSYKLAQDYGLPTPLVPSHTCIGVEYTGKLYPHTLLPTQDRQCYSRHPADSPCIPLSQQLPLACAAPGNASLRKSVGSPSSGSSTLKSSSKNSNCRGSCKMPEQVQVHLKHMEGQQALHKHAEVQCTGSGFLQEHLVQFSQMQQRQAMHTDEPLQGKQVVEHEEFAPGTSSSPGAIGENRSTSYNVGASVASTPEVDVRNNPGNAVYSAAPEATPLPANSVTAETMNSLEAKISLARSTAVAMGTLRDPNPPLALLHPQALTSMTTPATDTKAATSTKSFSRVAAAAVPSAAGAALLAAAAASPAAAAVLERQPDVEHSVQKRETYDVRGQCEYYAEPDSLSGFEVYTGRSQSLNDGSLQKLLSARSMGDSNLSGRRAELDQSDKLEQLMSLQAEHGQNASHPLHQGKQQVCSQRHSHQWQPLLAPDLQQQQLQRCCEPSTRNVSQAIHNGPLKSNTGHTGFTNALRAPDGPSSSNAPVAPSPEQRRSQRAGDLPLVVTRVSSAIDGGPVAPPFSTAIFPAAHSMHSLFFLDTLAPQQQQMITLPTRMHRHQRRELSQGLRLPTAPKGAQHRQQPTGQQEGEEGCTPRQHTEKLHNQQEEQRGRAGHVKKLLPARRAERQPQLAAETGAPQMTQGLGTLSYCSSDKERGEPHDFADPVTTSSSKTAAGNVRCLKQGQQIASTELSLDSFTTERSTSEKCTTGTVDLSPSVARRLAVATVPISLEGGLTDPVEVPEVPRETTFALRKATSHAFLVPPPSTQLHTGICCFKPPTPGAEPPRMGLTEALLEAPGVPPTPATAATICSKTEAAATAAVLFSTPDAIGAAASASVPPAASVVHCCFTTEASAVEESRGEKAALPLSSNGLSGLQVSAVHRNTPRNSASHARGVRDNSCLSLVFCADSSIGSDRSNRSTQVSSPARNRAASSMVSRPRENLKAGTEDCSISNSTQPHATLSSAEATRSGAHPTNSAALISACATIITAAREVAKKKTSFETECSQEKERQKTTGVPELQRQLLQQLKRLQQLHSQKQESNVKQKHERDTSQLAQEYRLVEEPGEPQNLQQQRSPECIQQCFRGELKEKDNECDKGCQKMVGHTGVSQECEKGQMAHLEDTLKPREDIQHRADRNVHIDPNTSDSETLPSSAALREKYPQQGEKICSTVQVQQRHSPQPSAHNKYLQIALSDDVAVTGGPQNWKHSLAAQPAEQRFGQQQQPHLSQHFRQQRQHLQERGLLLLKCLQRRYHAQQQLLKEQHLQREHEVQQSLDAPDPNLSSACQQERLRCLAERQQLESEESISKFGVLRRCADCAWEESNSSFTKHPVAADTPLAQPPRHCAHHKNGEAELVCTSEQTPQQPQQQPTKHAETEQTPQQLQMSQITPQQMLHLQNIQNYHVQNVLRGNHCWKGTSAAGMVVPKCIHGGKGTNSPSEGGHFVPENSHFAAEKQGGQHLAGHHSHSLRLCGVGISSDQDVIEGNTAVSSTNEAFDNKTERRAPLQGAADASTLPLTAATDENETRGSTQETAESTTRSEALLTERKCLSDSANHIPDSTSETLSEKHTEHAFAIDRICWSRQVLPGFGGISDKLDTLETTADVRPLKTVAEIVQAGSPAVAAKKDGVSVTSGVATFSRQTAPTEGKESPPWTRRGLVGAEKTLTAYAHGKGQVIARAEPPVAGHSEIWKHGASILSPDASHRCDSRVRQVSTAPQQLSWSFSDVPESNGEKRTEKLHNLPLPKTTMQRGHYEQGDHPLVDTSASPSLVPEDEEDAVLIAEVAALLSSGEDDDEIFEPRSRGGNHRVTPSAAPLRTNSNSWMPSGPTATLSQRRGSASEILLLPQLLWKTSESGNMVARLENYSSSSNVSPSSRHAIATHTCEATSSYLTAHGRTVEQADTLESSSTPVTIPVVQPPPAPDHARALPVTPMVDTSTEVAY